MKKQLGVRLSFFNVFIGNNQEISDFLTFLKKLHLLNISQYQLNI